MSGFQPFLGLFGQVGAAVGAFTQANYQARVAKNNARIAAENAARTSDAMQEEQKRSDMEYAQLIGEQTAAQSASGLDILGRTQQLTRLSSEGVRRAAGLDIYDEGTAKARNFLQESANLKGDAKQLRNGAWIKLGSDVSEIATGMPRSGKGGVPRSLAGSSSSTSSGRRKFFG